MAEHRAHVVQALRLLGDEVVLDDGPNAAGGAFRAQRQGSPFRLSMKGVHLLSTMSVTS